LAASGDGLRLDGELAPTGRLGSQAFGCGSRVHGIGTRQPSRLFRSPRVRLKIPRVVGGEPALRLREDPGGMTVIGVDDGKAARDVVGAAIAAFEADGAPADAAARLRASFAAGFPPRHVRG
jgi:hypothetical protein